MNATPPYTTEDRIECRVITHPDGQRPWFAGTVTACKPAWQAPTGWDLHVTLDSPPEGMNPHFVLWLEPDGTNPDVRRLGE